MDQAAVQLMQKLNLAWHTHSKRQLAPLGDDRVNGRHVDMDDAIGCDEFDLRPMGCHTSASDTDVDFGLAVPFLGATLKYEPFIHFSAVRLVLPSDSHSCALQESTL
jgi:hypothetical protein